jgi:carbon storage regulator
MLVLARKVGESINIGPGIQIKVLEIQADPKKVKLGFVAPDEARIIRKELLPSGKKQEPEENEKDFKW